MIDRYVAELDRALRGPRAAKADLLAEARDALVDAADAYEDSGLDRATAERRAVADFGEVRDVAPDYQTELALAQGRRTALLICAVLLFQPVAWQALLTLAGRAQDPAHPGYHLVDTLVRWSGGTAIVISLAVAFALGTGVRFLGPRRRITRLAGYFAFAVCASFAVLGLLLTALSAPGASALLGITGLPGTLVLLGVPLAGIGLSGRRCLAAA